MGDWETRELAELVCLKYGVHAWLTLLGSLYRREAVVRYVVLATITLGYKARKVIGCTTFLCYFSPNRSTSIQHIF